MDCLICNERLDPTLFDVGTHPTCDTEDATFNGLAMSLKQDLTEMVKWADRNSPRSRQAKIGPSELGSPCDRKLAYRLAGMPEVNHRRDPWPAIVGTGIHWWLEHAVNTFQEAHGLNEWVTEQELQVDPLVIGHTDLYKSPQGVVIDYKSAGPDAMKRAMKDGPPAGYKIQTHLYGKGHADAGRPVNAVALVFLPRAGWLGDMYVWTDRYRPILAHKALNRMYSIMAGIAKVDIPNNPQIWDKIPATQDHCGYCPFFKRGGLLDMGANEKGCPGV